MNKVDYIIVGLGLSGLCVAERLIQKGVSIKVIAPNTENASQVAGGMYNPIILKRFTLAWEANTQLEQSLRFYQALEHKLDVSINTKLPVYRRFHSAEEQNLWFEASDKPKLKQFIDPKITQSLNPYIRHEFGFGKVKHTGTIDTTLLLKTYRHYLRSNQAIDEDTFHHNALKINDTSISYKNITAKGIIFCEGFNVLNNPFFNYLDVRPNKGEYLIVKSTKLKLKAAVKSSIFIIPLGDDYYKIGATYDRTDTTTTATVEKKSYLLQKLKDLITCPFEVFDQIAGIRPTTKDRRPYVGRHRTHINMFVCNGLGSRGVMTSPVVAKYLCDNITQQTSISKDIDANRHVN